jgi:hypothetical protein
MFHGAPIGHIVDDRQGEVDTRRIDRSGSVVIVLVDVTLEPTLALPATWTASKCVACGLAGGTATWATNRAAVASVVTWSRSMTAEAVVRG